MAAPARDLRLIVLLDEMYSPEIARRLRALGHDASAVGERADLAGATDVVVYETAQVERRAIVTNNHAHFASLIQRSAAAGESSTGVILTADRSLPRTRAGIEPLVTALHAYLADHAADTAVPGSTAWLAPPNR